MKIAATLFAMLLLSCSACAGEALELETRMTRIHVHFFINEDGTAIESFDWSKKILKESAIEDSKRASISYSTSAQKADVAAAYTLKADGRRIDVPKDNYQLEVNSGKGKDSPVYSDWTTLTVVFPDVAVGDSVVFSYRITQVEPIFPGHYSKAGTFHDRAAYDDVRVRFDYPRKLWVQYEAHGMKETASEEKAGRRIVEWRHANPRPIRTDRRDYSVFDPDREVGYAFSTFRTHADIASAYGKRALPKAAATERVARLAAQIVNGKESELDQARVLYDWVATNITYAGNCIGIGAVVPRDIPFILDNKMGDCKDHATLLQALLAARGIKSTQALVNAGSLYKLPRIPVVSNVNHVINYLPTLDLYVDSTSDSTPFGMLPFSDQGKPVLLVENFREGTKTPVPAHGDGWQRATTKMRIGPDGSMTSSVEVWQKGHDAAQSRAWARKLTRQAEDDLIRSLFRNNGMTGSGSIEKDDPTALIDTYRYKASLSAEKFVKFPGAGAFYVFPPGFVSSMWSVLKPSMDAEKEADVTCSGGAMVEDYVIEFPDAMKVLAVPDDVEIAEGALTYAAEYRLNGNVLTIKRKLEDRTAGNVCAPQFMAEYRKTVEKVLDNLKQQVLYK